jgi:hypothetical protein
MAMASCMRRVASRPARSEPGSWRGEPRRAAPCLAGAVAAKQGATSRCAPTCHLPRYVGSRIRPRVALCCQANVARFSRETAVADARNRRWRPVLLHGTGSVRSAARRLGGSSLGPSAAPSTTQPALPLRVDASVRVRRDSSPSVSPEKLSRGDDRESWSLRLQPARRPCIRRQTGAPRSACASRSHRRRRHPLTMAGAEIRTRSRHRRSHKPLRGRGVRTTGNAGVPPRRGRVEGRTSAWRHRDWMTNRR